MNNPQSSDDIEAKLQSVEANLRKERDVARRKLQVADEKCRIAQGEVNSVKEQIDAAQTELAKLQDEIPRQEEIDERTHSLEVLSNEVRTKIDHHLADKVDNRFVSPTLFPGVLLHPQEVKKEVDSRVSSTHMRQTLFDSTICRYAFSIRSFCTNGKR